MLSYITQLAELDSLLLPDFANNIKQLQYIYFYRKEIYEICDTLKDVVNEGKQSGNRLNMFKFFYISHYTKNKARIILVKNARIID